MEQKMIYSEDEQIAFFLSRQYTEWIGNTFWQVACALTEHEYKIKDKTK